MAYMSQHSLRRYPFGSQQLRQLLCLTSTVLLGTATGQRACKHCQQCFVVAQTDVHHMQMLRTAWIRQVQDSGAWAVALVLHLVMS
jgi:hypothetical protein